MSSQSLLFPDLDVEPDESDTGGRASGEPWDPNLIRITSKSFSLRHIVDMIEGQEIDLAPDFQRRFLWGGPQKSRLVESILLRIPLPAFYFNEEKDGKLQVVDGVQRLMAIYEFARGALSDAPGKHDAKLLLENLQYLSELNGVGYDGLNPALRRRFDGTQIFVNVIDPQTPDTLKFDIFQRINTGGIPLNGQEIRHCISASASRSFLKRCASLKSFEDATMGSVKDHRRMVDRELALRFYAFRQTDWLVTYTESKSWDDFLLHMTRKLDAAPPAALDWAVNDFDRAMQHAWLLFNGTVFRKPADKGVNPINRSLFESWAVALAEVDPADTLPRKEAIVQEARRRMAGETEYINSYTMATSDLKRINKRFNVARQILRGGGP